MGHQYNWCLNMYCTIHVYKRKKSGGWLTDRKRCAGSNTRKLSRNKAIGQYTIFILLLQLKPYTGTTVAKHQTAYAPRLILVSRVTIEHDQDQSVVNSIGCHFSRWVSVIRLKYEFKFLVVFYRRLHGYTTPLSGNF